MENARSGGLNSSTLKIIAMVVMVIDHIGLALWLRLPELGLLALFDNMTFARWEFIYGLLRNIGRTAFPIFCFLLVEGFFHTSSRLKYGLRLLAFAFLSQIPFHYAFLTFTEGLNVFFTLFIGLMTIWGMEEIKNRLAPLLPPKHFIGRLAIVAGQMLVWAAGGYAAYLLSTDYDWKGVMLIGILYLCYYQRILALVIGYLSFFWEAFCLPGFVLCWFYNGKRGMKLKYAFYLIYPLHLSLLYVIWKYLPGIFNG